MRQSRLQRDIRTEAIASFTLLPGVGRDHLAAPRSELHCRISKMNNEVAAEARGLPRSLVQPMDGVIPDDLTPLRPYFNESLPRLRVWLDQQIRRFIRGKGDSQHPGSHRAGQLHPRPVVVEHHRIVGRTHHLGCMSKERGACQQGDLESANRRHHSDRTVVLGAATAQPVAAAKAS